MLTVRSDHRTPEEIDDDALLARLFEIQTDVRDLLLQYKIKPTSFTGMARQARLAISSTEIRANLLELLIELQEFGAAAKERGVIGEAAMTDSGTLTSSASAATTKRRGQAACAGGSAPKTVSRAPPPGTAAPGSKGTDSSAINQTASDAFFVGLNDSGPDRD